MLQQQRGWMEILAEAARRAVRQGHFRADLDAEQFAHELQAVILGYHHADRLMRSPDARERVEQSFESLIERAQD